MRVKESITRFIEKTLYLKVNKEKTVVSYVRGVKYLGYSFYMMKGKCQLTVHPKSKAKMKSRLKELTSRSNGWGYAKRKQKLKEYIRGWVGYYHLADMKSLLRKTDEWLRRSRWYRFRHSYQPSYLLGLGGVTPRFHVLKEV